jgi:hypothetical protein
MAMFDKLDRLYAELGVPPEEPEDALDTWRRLMEQRKEPPPRERVAFPTLAEVDQRIGEQIAAEHELMIEIIGEVVAELQSDAEMRGPPGPAGPRSE